MAKTPTSASTFPTTGGSYARKPTGGLDQVEATQPPPDVQEHESLQAPAAPSAASQEPAPAGSPAVAKES